MSTALVRAVYEAYGQALHRYLMRRLSNSQTARDLAQEVYVRLLAIPNPEFIRSPQTYVYRVASNLVYEFRLREQRDVVTFDSQLTDSAASCTADPSIPEPGEWLNVHRQLEDMLRQLTPLHAAILVMRKRDGNSYDEIPTELRISVHTVKKYLAQAAARCRAQRVKSEKGEKYR